MYIVSKFFLFSRNLLRSSAMQITLCLLFFLLQIRVAYLQDTTIDFTINSTCGSIAPVFDTSYKLLANDRFCVGFSSLFQNKLVFGIFANWQGDAQMIWYADVSDPIGLGSRLFLNRYQVLVLQPRNSGRTVWAANAANLTGWKLTDIGTFVLYDGQNNSIWESMDYLTDTLFMGQSFTSTSEIMKVSDYRLSFAAYGCKIEFFVPQLSRKPRLQSISGNVFLNFSNSAGFTIFTFWSYEDGRDLSNAFIRLHPLQISIYTLLNGKWDIQIISFNTLKRKNPQVIHSHTCRVVHWSHELLSSLERVLCGFLILLLFSECLFLFIGALTAYSKILLLIIATIPPSSIAVALMISQQYLMPNKFHTPYAIHAIVLTIIMLHVVNIILCWITYTRALSNLAVIRNTSKGLLLLNMLALLSAHLGVYFFRSLSTNDLNVKELGYFLILGLLAHTNTICLIVETLPGRKRFGSDARIIIVIISNISIGAISGFQIYWNSVHPYQYLHNHIIWVCLLAANGILILLSLWGCYAHDLMTGRFVVVLARINSLKTWCGRQRKRIVVWLVSCLVGRSKPLKDPEDDITMSLSYFRYEELEVVTDGFSRLLGQGGFGGVYNGTLLSGKKVAVKKLESASQGNKEFKAEIKILGRVHHLNLASLLGFCAEGPNRLLVYDLMANGSLDKWIFEDGPFLDWPTRLNILVGTARGLAYLHEECDPRIIHLDVKPQNILLDESFGAKVSDFGLCMFLSKDESSLVLTRMMGTMGYLAPERVQGLVTEKSDVYSFGIVMLEVISGNRGYKTLELEENFQPFRTWAIQRMHENSLIDPRLQHCVNEAESKRIIEVALWCTRYDPNKRPSMGNVVKMLEGSAEIPYCRWTEEITLFTINEDGE